MSAINLDPPKSSTANERFAHLQRQIDSLNQEIDSLRSHERWLTNIVARLSQRLEVAESANETMQLLSPNETT